MLLKNPKVIGVLLTLEKNGREVFVTVYLSMNKVLVGNEGIVM